MGLESPEQTGNVELHGGLWKTPVKRAIHTEALEVEDLMMMIWAFCHHAIANGSAQKGGSSPSQKGCGAKSQYRLEMYLAPTHVLMLAYNRDMMTHSLHYTNKHESVWYVKASNHMLLNTSRAVTLRKEVSRLVLYVRLALISFKREQGATT